MSINQQTKVWTRRQALWLISGATGGLALHGCAQKAETNSAQSTQTASTKLVSATSAGTLWIGYTPLYIALEKGFFKEGGLNLDYKDFSSNTEMMAAFGAGRLEGESFVTFDAVTLAAKGVDYRIVMAADTSFGGDGILARNSISDIKAFKGKKVALEEGGVSHFFLLQVMKEAGLSRNDVTIVNLTPDAAAAAYQAGRADIAVTYSPFLQRANQAQKDGRIIYDSSKMPTAIVDVYTFSPKFVEANPNATKAFVQGIFKGKKFLETNKEEALAIAGKRLQLKPAEVEQQLKGVKLVDLPTNVKMLGEPQSNIYLLNHMNELAQFLTEQKQIPKPPDLSKVLDPKFLNEIQA